MTNHELPTDNALPGGTVTLYDTVGAVFLGILALILAIALLRSQAQVRELTRRG